MDKTPSIPTENSNAKPHVFGMQGLTEALSLQNIGEALHAIIRQLYPICRSITGDGVRQTLKHLSEHIPLSIREVPTGTAVFDWVVPKEWNIRDAYVKNSRGERVIDFQHCNLHVIGYSTPIKAKMSLAELKPHLFSMPDKPDWIQYRNSFYKESWGFCLAHKQLQALPEDEYEVYIDSSLEEGSLTYGEYLLPGSSTDEVLISCHVCHPSLCNDNLSGISVATLLASYLGKLDPRHRHYSYRFVFVPVTIGSITWLALNEKQTENIKHGLVLSLLGDSGSMTYKRSRRGNAAIDSAAEYVLTQSQQPHTLKDFIPYGYDERQYCSPGFNLPVGSLMRTPHGEFPEYHTSGDNPDFVKPYALADSLEKILAILNILELNRKYLNLNPKCEPMLGRRGVYKALADQKDNGLNELALLWTLNYSDGQHSLLDIAKKSGIAFTALNHAAQTLVSLKLIQKLMN